MAITKQEVLDELKALHQVYSDASRRVLALTMKVQNMPEAAFHGQATELAVKVGQGELAITGDNITISSPHTHIAAAASRMAAEASEQMPMRTPHPKDGVLDHDGKTTQPRHLVYMDLGNTPADQAGKVVEARISGVDFTKLTPGAAAALAGAEAASQTQRAVFIPQMNTQEAIDAAKNAASPMQVALASAQSLLKEAMRNAGTPQHVIDLVDKVGVEHLAQKPVQTVGYVVPVGDRIVDMPRELSESKSEQPTEAQVQAEVEQGILSAFIGRGSLFMEHLHNSMLFGARGELQAGYELADGKLMKRFENDAFWAESRVLPKWPTGFYLDRDTKQLQFLVNTDQFACLLTALPSEHSPVKIHFYGMPDGWKDIADFALSEQKLIHAKVSDTLLGLKKK